MENSEGVVRLISSTVSVPAAVVIATIATGWINGL
jgi:hypothetical protein